MRLALYAVHGLRETQHTGLARKIIGTGSSVSPLAPLHTLLICTASKRDGSNAPLTPGYTSHTFLFIPAGQAQWATTELASALVVANLGHGSPDGMVWYAYE